jgi:DNA topoisomerase I
MKLVIVESPAKAKKIASFLGEGWRVEACRGHVCDLPKDKLGVDVKKEFRPTCTLLPRKGSLVNRLIKAMRQVDAVYLATDPDREGEAIAWHLLQLAQLDKSKSVYRATFNAITESAVKQAIQSPQQLDTALVEAQQTRRILDRLVGYLVSPLACKTLNGKVSAGRVQSVALRLVVEREQAIQAFTSENFWTLSAQLQTGDVNLTVKLHRIKGADVRFTSPDQVQKLVGLLQPASFWIGKAGQSVQQRKPLPPFTTSTLQQAASKALGLSPQRTMQLAQTLYEAGWITYHRTDSVAVSPEVRALVRQVIRREYGEDYRPAKPPNYTSKKLHTQDAHEAIRPTNVQRQPEAMQRDGADLYALIWKRFIASQMTSARYNVTQLLIMAGKQTDKPFPLAFKAQGREQVFDGFLRVYEEVTEDDEDDGASNILPYIKQGTSLDLIDLPIKQGQTQAPKRFTEAGLVQKLEAEGVGRPSTYAGMVGTIQTKGYVSKQKRHLIPTEIGTGLCAYLIEQFPSVFDVGYTAQLEATLDEIASGNTTRLQALQKFWSDFQPQLQSAGEAVIKSTPQPTGEICPECGGELLERRSTHGVFVGCANYPTCTHTQKVDHKPIRLLSVED